MEINKELKHIAEYQNSILPRHQKRTEEAIEIIANDAIESLKNGTFDFKFLWTTLISCDNMRNQ